MIAVAPQRMAAEASILELVKVPIDLGLLWTQVAALIPPLTVNSPPNAVFDEGIGWEDAEWQ